MAPSRSTRILTGPEISTPRLERSTFFQAPSLTHLTWATPEALWISIAQPLWVTPWTGRGIYLRPKENPSWTGLSALAHRLALLDLARSPRSDMVRIRSA